MKKKGIYLTSDAHPVELIAVFVHHRLGSSCTAVGLREKTHETLFSIRASPHFADEVHVIGRILRDPLLTSHQVADRVLSAVYDELGLEK